MLNIYCAHSIRGKLGNAATPESMKANCDKAIEFGNWLRVKFPDVRFYVPGEMDEFLMERGVVTLDLVEELLGLDCGIIGHSDGLIVFEPDDYISGGMAVELAYCDDIGIPTCSVDSINSASDQLLEQIVYNFLKGLE
jgi:hypothetical protein